MKESLIARLGVGIGFAIIASLLSVVLVGAEAPPPDAAPPPQELNCSACHAELHTTWELGAHGVASTNETFTEAWQIRGEPSECMVCHTTGYDAATETWEEEGITCAACHSPAAEGHPEEPMPIARESDTCGVCHTQAYFEWQASQHGKIDLACASCHDPHATGLKADDVSSQCSACHGATVSTFAHSQHYAQGQTCADCHLAPTGEEVGEGSARRDHTFAVDLSTCTACHAYQLHSSGEDTPVEPTDDPMSLLGSVDLETSGTAEPVSPIGFAVLAGLVGMAGGMILAPWLERWYRRIRRDDERG
jgi:hypothetical protein